MYKPLRFNNRSGEPELAEGWSLGSSMGCVSGVLVLLDLYLEDR